MKRLITTSIAALLLQGATYAQGWERVGKGGNALNVEYAILGLCYDNGTLYAKGENTVDKWNGVSWEPVGTGSNGFAGSSSVGHICADKQHNIYTLGGLNAQQKLSVMKWDGAAWSELGEGIPAYHTINDIHALCVDKDDNVYAAGAFRDTTGTYYVAKWDGTSWSPLGTGSNALNANSVIRALATDSHGNIYAAGQFTRSGYVYVAKWDGATWSPVGNGNNPLNCISSYSSFVVSLYVDVHDNVYAGGQIKNAEGRYYVAKWNGQAWTEMSDPDGTSYSTYGVEDIAGDKAGNIYVSGRGVQQGPLNRYTVKRWDGTKWVEAGGGSLGLNANQQVEAICTDASGGLYAGGYFTDGSYMYDGHKYVAKINAQDIVAEAPATRSINAWPNPSNGVLTVEGPEFGEYIYVCDMLGAVRTTIQNRLAASAAKPVIDVSELPAGCYFLRSHNCVPFFFNKR